MNNQVRRWTSWRRWTLIAMLAAAMIKQVTLALGMVPVDASVSIPFVGTAIDDGRFVPTDIMVESAYATLADLRSMLDAMAHLPR